MVAGATSSQSEAAAAAAEEARRIAAEQARQAAIEQAQREAAEQAQREAQQQAAQVKQQAEAAQNQTNQTAQNSESKITTEQSKANGSQRTSELEPYSERKNIDAANDKNYFESKPQESTQSKSNKLFSDFNYDQKIEKPHLGKQDSSSTPQAGKEPGLLQGTFDKARSFVQKVTDSSTVNKFLDDATKTVESTLDKVKNAVKNTDETALLGKLPNNSESSRTALSADKKVEQNDSQSSITRNNNDSSIQTTKQASEATRPVEDHILEVSRNGDATLATQTLHDEIQKRKSPAERNQLLGDQRINEAVGNVARNLTQKDNRPSDETVQQSLENLSRTAELTDAEGANKLAQAFSRGISGDYGRIEPDGFTKTGEPYFEGGLGREMADSIKNGAGLSFAANLSHELLRTGKTDAGVAVSSATQDSLRQVRSDFAENAKKVEELNGKLANLVGGFDAALSDEQKQNAIAAFKEEHAAEYSAFENDKATTNLISTLDGAQQALDLPELNIDSSAKGGDLALRSEATEILKELPRVGQTDKGLEKIADAIEKQGAGQRTFMDLVPSVAKTTSDGTNFVKKVSDVAVKATGMRLLEHAEAGDLKQAGRTLYDGLFSNKELFGLNDSGKAHGTAALDKIETSLYQMHFGDRSKALKDLDQAINELEGGVPGLDKSGRSMQALRGLGLIASIAGAPEAHKDFSNKDLKDQIKTIGNDLQVGVDGGTLALDVARRGSSPLGSVLGKAGLGLGAVSTVMDGITSVEQFRDGKYADATLSGASAVGGGILTVAGAYSLAGAAQVVPLWGQIAGGALVAGTTIGKMALDKHREYQDEADAQAFLQGAGLPAPTAESLSDLTSTRENVGPFINQLAPYLGTSPQEFLKHLSTLDPAQLDDIVQMSRGLKVNDEGKYEMFAENDSEVGEMRYGYHPNASMPYQVMPQSIYGAAQWMRKNNYAPPVEYYNGSH